MKLPFSIIKQSINSFEPPNQKRTIIPSLITIKPSKNLQSYLFPPPSSPISKLNVQVDRLQYQPNNSPIRKQMDFYFPYQNNTYPTHSLSLYFTNITDFSLQQWITNHCTQIHQSQNVHIEPIYMRVEQREERRTENIIIEPIQKQYIIQHTAIQSNSSNRQEPSANKKQTQKQSRNVFSNLLRIFFKNILELHSYTHLINRIIRQHCMATSEEDFYEWLQRFGINFKNYIKLVSVRRLVDNPKRRDHVLIFNILLRNYISAGGKQHCLSSKRIDKSSIKMHLLGLRQLSKALSTPTI